MKKNYFFRNAAAAFALLMSVSLSFQSCGNSDNPIEVTPSDSGTGIKITDTATGASVEVSNLENLAEAISQLKDKIAANGTEEYVIDVNATGLETSSEVNEITVPLAEGSKVKLNFTNSISTSEPLTFKSESTATEPAESKNNLTIALPSNSEASAIDLNIDMPETTVTLESADGSNVYINQMDETTAQNTLIIGSKIYFINEIRIREARNTTQNIYFDIEGDKNLNNIFATDTQFNNCITWFNIKKEATGTPVITLKECWWTRSDVFHGQFKMEEGCNIDGLKFVIDGGWYGAGKVTQFANDVPDFIISSNESGKEYRGDAISVPVTIVINGTTYTAPANSKTLTLTEVTE